MSHPAEAAVSDGAAATPDPPTGARGPGLPGADRAWSRHWRTLAVVAPLLCLAVNAYVVWGTRWPAFPYDEVNLLQIARLVAGQEIPDVIEGAGYFPLWSLLVAPVFWLTSDPSTAYQATLWIGVAVGMVTIWPLALVVRRLGVPTAPAVVVATFAMTLPARAVQADFSMSERLLTLLLVCAVLCAYRVAERPTVLRNVVLALVLGLMFFSHVRLGVVLGAAGVWLLMRAVRTPLASLVGLVTLVAAGWVANVAGRALNEAMLGRPFSQGDSLVDKLELARPSLFLRVGTGQAWYQTLASYGLVTVGLVLLVVLTWQQLRRWDVGAPVFVLGATVAMTLLSLAQWAADYLLFLDEWVRLDAWVYGRYIDPIATVVVAFGLAVVLTHWTRAAAAWAIGLTAVAGALGFGFLTREVPTWGFVTPAHVPGLLPWRGLLPTEPFGSDGWIVPTFTNENRIWLVAPLCVLAMLVGAFLLRSRPLLVAGAFVVLAAAGTVVADGRTDTFHETESAFVPIAETVQELQAVDEQDHVAYLKGCGVPGGGRPPGQNYFGYGVAPTPMLGLRDGEPVDTQIVIACEEWPAGVEQGARRVDVPPAHESALWVMPGVLQDELASEGRLLP